MSSRIDLPPQLSRARPADRNAQNPPARRIPALTRPVQPTILIPYEPNDRMRLIPITLTLTLLLSTQSLPAQTPSFTGLGDLPGGEFHSSATALSADGRVVVGSSTAADGRQAFRWSATDGMIDLGDLPGRTVSSGATGLSADGRVVVGAGYGEQGQEAFRWTRKTGMHALGTLPRLTVSTAFGVSGNGKVIVGSSSSPNGVFESFRWTNGRGMASLGDLPGGRTMSQAEDVSASGRVIVGYGTRGKHSQRHAYRWTKKAGMKPLFRLEPGADSQAHGVSADGRVIVGSTAAPGDPRDAFRWTKEGGVQELGELFDWWDSEDHALAASGDGSIIVGFTQVTFLGRDGPVAFIWDEQQGLRSVKRVLRKDFGLDLTGWKLHVATDISHDGSTIVGSGINPDGDLEAWIARLPPTPATRRADSLLAIPEPTTLPTLAATATLLSLRRRRTRESRGDTRLFQPVPPPRQPLHPSPSPLPPGMNPPPPAQRRDRQTQTRSTTQKHAIPNNSQIYY
jgi:probable HAF family extracellular repeat protein